MCYYRRADQVGVNYVACCVSLLIAHDSTVCLLSMVISIDKKLIVTGASYYSYTTVKPYCTNGIILIVGCRTTIARRGCILPSHRTVQK